MSWQVSLRRRAISDDDRVAPEVFATFGVLAEA